MKRRLFVPLALPLVLAGLLLAADRGRPGPPGPNAPMSEAAVKTLTGDWEGARLSRDVRILWLSGPEDHGGGEHDYIRVREMFVPLLKKVPRVTVEEAFLFPTEDQFERADLLVQYLHLPDLTDEQFAMFQAFVERGGAVVSIHESCIMRPVARAEKLADCIGCSWKGNKESRWSKFGHDHPVHLDTGHPAFAGLPKSVQLNDESYWNLLAREEVEVIGVVAPAGPANEDFKATLAREGVRSHAFWTYQRGKGRVFGTTTGHYTYTFHDPVYRLLLLRGMAWTLNEDPKPFLPLVFDGITDENGMVGTTDRMMDYRNRRR